MINKSRGWQTTAHFVNTFTGALPCPLAMAPCFMLHGRVGSCDRLYGPRCIKMFTTSPLQRKSLQITGMLILSPSLTL